MNKTLYPLTQTQEVIMYSLKFVPQTHGNLISEFEFTCDIDKNLMMQAVTLSLMRNPSNYTRLTKVGKEIKQYFTDEQLNKVEYKEYTDNDVYENELAKFAQKAFPNRHLETQLVKVRVAKKPNGNIAIIGCFSHMIYDGYSITMAFKDICDVYKALLHDNPIPKISYPLTEAFEIDYAYLNSEKCKNDEEYFTNVTFNTEPQFTCLNGKEDKCFTEGQRKGKLAVSLSMKGSLIELPLDKELVDNINSYSSNNRISAQTVYVLATRSYLSKVCGDIDDVSIGNIIDRRPTLIQKKAGGTMGDAVFLRTAFGNDISFKEALEKVNEIELETFKHSSYGMVSMTNITKKKFNCSSTDIYTGLMFSYMPGLYDEDELKYKIRRVSNGTEVTNICMYVTPCDSDFNYSCTYLYQTKFISKETINKFHNFLTKFIKIGLENDSLTMKEIIERAMNN